MDSLKNIKRVQEEYLCFRHNLTARDAFVTKENINQLISNAGFSGQIGLLHIDIDGNDYWIWDAITCVTPAIVIMEYNSVFGIDRAITIPYDKEFNRTQTHYSNLFFGASLLALSDLAQKKGYVFVGCNSSGNNAYFVKKENVGKVRILKPQEGYVYFTFRESLDQNGKLTFISGDDRAKLIRGLQVYNTRTNVLEPF